MIVEVDAIAIGQRLREVRGGLSQGEFAQKMKVTQHSISNYETGKRIPDVSFLISIMNEYSNIDLAWLISGQVLPVVGKNGRHQLSPDEEKLLGKYRDIQKDSHRKIIDDVINMALEKK